MKDCQSVYKGGNEKHLSIQLLCLCRLSTIFVWRSNKSCNMKTLLFFAIVTILGLGLLQEADGACCDGKTCGKSCNMFTLCGTNKRCCGYSANSQGCCIEYIGPLSCFG